MRKLNKNSNLFDFLGIDVLTPAADLSNAAVASIAVLSLTFAFHLKIAKLHYARYYSLAQYLDPQCRKGKIILPFYHAKIPNLTKFSYSYLDKFNP